MRDRTVGDTFFIAFTTRAFATGIPTVLAGTPVVSAYEDASLTQITAGITLGVDHDGVVGLNMLTIVATGANGFETVKDYNLVITTGTVGGVSVVGEVVGQFSLGLSAAAVDLANATDGLGAIKTVVDAIPTTAMRGTDSAALASVIGTPSDFGSGTSTISANLEDMADDGTASFDRSTDSLQALRDRGDAAWTTGSGTGLTALANGTAQGGTSSTIQLASGETFANGEPDGNIIKITSGTGNGQSRVIISYVGSTDTATVSPDWTTTPDATSVYEMVNGSVNVTAVSNSAEDIATATAVAALNDFNPASDAVANVTLVATTTTNTDMRGTDSAATAAALAALNDISVADILTTQMTQSYAADGVAPTLAQSQFLIQQMLGDFIISGTTLIVREIDGSTTAATFTLDSSTVPTSLTRVS